MQCRSCNRRRANIDLRRKFKRKYPTLKIITSDVFSEEKITIECSICKNRFQVYRKHLIGKNITNFSEKVDLSNVIFFKNKKKPFECPVCKINKVKKEFYRVVEERECSVIGEYKNNTTPVLIECNHCHTQFKVVPQYYINKIVSKCKFCKTKPKGIND